MNRNYTVIALTSFVITLIIIIVVNVSYYVKQRNRVVTSTPSEVIDSLESKKKQLNYKLDSIENEIDTIGIVDSAVNLLDW